MQNIIDEYSEDYCQQLEAAYGFGMMSEGGFEAIDHLFNGINLAGKQVLEIGFGFGAAAIYLAERYRANVSGVEINPYLVKAARERVPDNLRCNLHFELYESNLPFSDNAFDIVFSKGVLTHVDDKTPLFAEMYRVTKPGGKLIINDWLSPQKGQWGKRLQQMCDIENLTIFAETEEGYQQLLTQAGFKDIEMADENVAYSQYNYSIANQISQENHFAKAFGQQAAEDAIKGYRLIADSIADNELLIRKVMCQK